MLEQSGANTGSFRIRSTGYAGDAKVSIVATYKRASLLDYIYFTQYETSDPVTYGNAALIAGAYEQCTKFRREGRESQSDPGTVAPVLRQDRLRQRRPHQGTATHQRRPGDLRHARHSVAPPPT